MFLHSLKSIGPKSIPPKNLKLLCNNILTQFTLFLSCLGKSTNSIKGLYILQNESVQIMYFLNHFIPCLFRKAIIVSILLLGEIKVLFVEKSLLRFLKWLLRAAFMIPKYSLFKLLCPDTTALYTNLPLKNLFSSVLSFNNYTDVY